MTRLRLTLFTFLGALLLFGMEPLVGKLLLPACGGSFHVWATCLMFFQAALFGGYLYCHVLAPRVGRWHLLLVLLPLVFLPIGRWLQELNPDPNAPAAAILGVLALSVGVPFAVLSSTGVMAQRWLAESELSERLNPYPLFAASNGGSLLALLGYPLLVEPFLGLTAQRWTWSAAYLGYVVLCFAVAPRKAQPTGSSAAPADEGGEQLPPEETAPTLGDYVFWTLLAAAPSACLLAVTNVIALDLGSAPLVWVVPLSLYLLSFILVFGEPSRYPRFVRRFWPEATAVGLLLWFMEGAGLQWYEAGVHLAVLMLVCMVGHGELHRARPAPRRLTGFYLSVALGGWIGGAFVSLVAPHLFQTLAEYPLSVLALGATLVVGRRRAFAAWLAKEHKVLLAISVLLFTLVGLKATEVFILRSGTNEKLVRNVYGIYRIQDVPVREPRLGELTIRRLTHARTVHGKEIQSERGYGLPIGFFHKNAPLGQVLRGIPSPRRVAIVGLGAGALAGHLERGDELVFYELDPAVETFANEEFHFLKVARDRGATVKVVPGDARLHLASTADAAYDLLIVDAFSSDAIPTHLLTEEALALYLKKIKPNGLLAFHISNRYYDLRPVLKATGDRLQLAGCYQSKLDGRRLALFEDATKAYVLARDPARLAPLLRSGWKTVGDDLPKVKPWTDDYANILGALWAGYVERKKLRGE